MTPLQFSAASRGKSLWPFRHKASSTPRGAAETRSGAHRPCNTARGLRGTAGACGGSWSSTAARRCRPFALEQAQAAGPRHLPPCGFSGSPEPAPPRSRAEPGNPPLRPPQCRPKKMRQRPPAGGGAPRQGGREGGRRGPVGQPPRVPRPLPLPPPTRHPAGPPSPPPPPRHPGVPQQQPNPRASPVIQRLWPNSCRLTGGRPYTWEGGRYVRGAWCPGSRARCRVLQNGPPENHPSRSPKAPHLSFLPLHGRPRARRRHRHGGRTTATRFPADGRLRQGGREGHIPAISRHSPRAALLVHGCP